MIDDGPADEDQFPSIPVHLAIGFLIVAAVFTATGFMISRTLAWTLAGLSGWAAGIGLQFEETHGEWLSLVVGTVIVAILFFGFVLDPEARAGRRGLPHPAQYLARLALSDHRQRARRRTGPGRRRRGVDHHRGTDVPAAPKCGENR